MPEPETAPSSPADRTRLRGWVEALVAGGLAFLVGLSFYRQGLDLGADGTWLLGARELVGGGGLYDALEPGDGPLRYWLLAPFLLVSEKAGALALLRALGLGLAGGLSVAWLAREGVGRLRWLAPVGLFALTPADPGLGLLLAAALLTLWRSEKGATVGQGLLLVLALALDLRWAGAVLLILLLGRPPRRDGLRPTELLLGLLAGAALLLLLVPATGPLAAVARNTFEHPWYRLTQHFADAGAGRWWSTLQSGLWVHLPFAGLGTGEELAPLLPGHAALRAWSFRLMTALTLLLPLVLLFLHRHRPRSRALAVATLATSAWILLSRGDAPALTAAFALPWLLLLLTTVDLSPRVGRALVTVAGLVLLPLAVEAGWLSLRIGRPELEHWPRAGVAVARERQERLEEFFSRVQPATERPMVIWPEQAGLHPVFEVPTALPYVTLGGLDLPAGTRSRALVDADPQVVILAQSWTLTAQAMRSRDPLLWDSLRERYRIAGWLRGRTDRLRLLVRLEPDQSLQTLLLPQQLPLLELTVANESSPAMRRNLTVGQSFRLGDRDLEGFAVRWSTEGTDLEFPVRVRVWQRRGQEFDALLSARSVRVTVAGDGARSFVRMPVEETANLEIALTLEVRTAPTDEVRLRWHRHDVGDQDVDTFPEGTALLNLEPIDADLYLVVY